MHIHTTQVVWLSLKVSIIAVTFSLPFAIFWGWLLARKQFPFKMAVETLLSLPLVLPPVVTGFLLLVVFGRQGVVGKYLYEATGLAFSFTWEAAALAAAVVSFPLFVRAVRVAIEGVDPRLEEAARVLRSGQWRTFFTITLPLSRNGVAAGGLLAFARSLGEFGATIMVAGNIPGKTQTIPLALFSAFNQPDGQREALILIAVSVLLAYSSLAGAEMLHRRWHRVENYES